jgi:hypothetical protein
MIHDPIIGELERLREQEMARYGYDPQRFFEALQEAQRRSKRAIEPTPSRATQDQSRHLTGE